MNAKEMVKKAMLLAALATSATFPAMAETLCSGESTEVKLDLATGTVRTPAATETLAYSTEWDDGSAVTLAVNGTTLEGGLTGSGTYDWTPSGSGLFTLTHTTTTGSGNVVLSALFEVAASQIVPMPVANTTFEIFTNGVSIGAGESTVTVKQGTPAYVVYTAEDEYVFASNVSVVTNECDTSTNPATVATPNAPGKIISNVPCAKTDETVVVPAEKPAATQEEVWDKATNMVATVTTAQAPAIVADQVLTNAVQAAKQTYGGDRVTRVLACVDVKVTPTEAEADARGDVRMVKMDVTPYLTTYAEVTEGATVMTNQIAAATTEFAYSGKAMRISFSVADLADAPMLIVHTHGTASYRYVRGDAATETTFVYDAATETVSLMMGTFSELAVYSDIQVGDSAYARVTDGVCTITGTGAMWSYETTGKSPLWDYRNAIVRLVVSDGVTRVGARFFENFWYLTDVTLASSVTAVGVRAFKKCYGLATVTSQATEAADVGDYAFSGCHSLQTLSFAGGVTFGTQAYAFQTAIYMKDGGIPEFYTVPAITVPGLTAHVMGKVKLSDATWEDVTDLNDEQRKTYHFFRIEVR